MVVWVLNAEYRIKGNGILSDTIVIYGDYASAITGIQTHLKDGYQDEPNFECFCVIGIELDVDDQDDYTITRFNRDGTQQ